MRVAALDLGSNTSLLLIADVADGRVEQVLHDETTVTRLGQGVHAQRRFHPEALARLDKCLASYARTIARFHCAKVVAVATSAARDVSNGDELLQLGRRHGIPISIISGVTEAALTFRGSLSDRAKVKQVAVIDVGGGSTEIISQPRPDAPPSGVSVDVGSVRLTELFVKTHPVSASECEALRTYAREAFSSAPALAQINVEEVVAVAGTPTTLAMLEQKCEFSEARVHGFKLTLECIERWARDLAALTIEQRETLPGMQPKRADVIVAGALILAEGLRCLGKTEVTVSTRGVRYGVALAWQDF